MPSKEHLSLVEKVAKAINGPFHPVPEGSTYTLDQLRDIRWQQINGGERKLCLAAAQAAISTILSALLDECHITGNHQIKKWLTDASALGEQSE